MHPKALLDHAAALLRAVLAFEQAADAVVSAHFRRERALGARDRHALAETVYAVLRRRLFYQHLCAGAGGVPERRLAIVGWHGDARTLEAALDHGERAWWAKAQAARDAGDGGAGGALPDKLRHNLPDWLAGALHKQLDAATFRALTDALLAPAPLDLRVNTLKARRDAVQLALQPHGIDARPTPWSPWGLRIDGRPAIQSLAAFRDGWFEVQDEGSQLLALLVDAKRGEMVADFCAGAGGKTLALGAAMRNTGRLYAFDTAGHRLHELKARVARAGLSNVHTVQIARERDDRIARLAGKLDRVLVDAPCSGLGTLRRNPDLKWRQSPQAIAQMRQRQEAILASAARLLKPGGRLVYATCSLLAVENEQVTRAFEGAHPSFEALPAQAALAAAHVERAAELVEGPYLKLWPHRHGTDGFFAAAWRRVG
ncbi:MAG: RsmB/NOP family class I SAM-dependent RNA methyltransferase [Ideonella sp.]|nr:RsmB/NOP family class I SAM-dependent RNA methyltransferase [Ideonella sp.]MCC7456145.1 RsmB/NOP family class I SAM-dependent RNA methyltransferase [Nitrospira sp.]